MSALRSLLLAGSQSRWLRRQATRRRAVRRAVSRFMPGETLDDALRAAAALGDRGLDAILTYLGENVEDRAEAESVVGHYLEVLERVRDAGLDGEISVKLTQLGLDLGPDLAYENTLRILERARALGSRVWIDMEASPYTEATLDIFRRARAEYARVGVCLQAYLHRTRADAEELLRLGACIRLVKGAYREPPRLALQRRRDVDENFFALAERLLGAEARQAGAWLTLGTHDPRLIARIEAHAAAAGVPRDGLEFALLYGIKRREQARLARAGYRVRVLISYGPHWFPWYMRRLAERPANLLFAMRNVFGG